MRLARFSDVVLDNPDRFGGGAALARVERRVTMVSYGYVGVVDGYADPETGTTWCLLTLTLPGMAPPLVVDHRSAFGRPGVPAGPTLPPGGDREFDARYAVGATPAVARAVLSRDVRRLLVSEPVQRLVLRGETLIIRTFDGTRGDEATIRQLCWLVEQILTSTPSFVTPRSGRTVAALQHRVLPPGLYAPDETEIGGPSDRGASGRDGSGRGGSGRGASGRGASGLGTRFGGRLRSR